MLTEMKKSQIGGVTQAESPNGVNELDDTMDALQESINSLSLQAVAEDGLWEDIEDELEWDGPWDDSPGEDMMEMEV